MRILVLGGYGFIGLEIVRRLYAADHEIVCLARSAELGQRLFPRARWVRADITTLLTPGAWVTHLTGVDVVVNAAGALQTGAGDHLGKIHHGAIAAAVRACESAGVQRFVQISAVGAAADASTEFMRSKAQGDEALQASTLDWFVIRPGLVLGPNAYGGSALLRMVAAVPIIQPVMHGASLVQTVSIRDVADVVLDAAEQRLPPGTQFDLVEQTPHELREVIRQLRAWVGLPPARMTIELPDVVAASVAKLADGLGQLGWRSPARSTAMRVLRTGIHGDPDSFRAVSERPLCTLEETIAAMPATVQERWFARLYLLLPLMVAVLCAFWILSGAIPLADIASAAALTGLGEGTGRALVIGGAIIDISVGMAVLYRPWARNACWLMVLVSLSYLLAGTVLRPDLWAHPLGPLLKIPPIALLAVVTAALLDAQR